MFFAKVEVGVTPLGWSLSLPKGLALSLPKGGALSLPKGRSGGTPGIPDLEQYQLVSVKQGGP